MTADGLASLTSPCMIEIVASDSRTATMERAETFKTITFVFVFVVVVVVVVLILRRMGKNKG